jgi:hypothetical protein
LTEQEFKQLPAWIGWLAQDADGAWWGYEAEPLQHHKGWYENEIGRCLKLAAGEANPHWQGTLKRIRQA